jgi:hypothetical protein
LRTSFVLTILSLSESKIKFRSADHIEDAMFGLGVAEEYNLSSWEAASPSRSPSPSFSGGVDPAGFPRECRNFEEPDSIPISSFELELRSSIFKAEPAPSLSNLKNYI